MHNYLLKCPEKYCISKSVGFPPVEPVSEKLGSVSWLHIYIQILNTEQVISIILLIL